MKNILISLLVLFSTILSAAPQSKSGQVGFYQVTGVAGTNRFLWDRTNDWLVLTHGALVFGTNKPVVVAEIIRAISDSTAGDPSARTVTIEANDTGAGDYGGAVLNVNNAGDASFTLYNHLAFGYGVEFNIRAPDGVTPFSFNNTVNHTSGSLLSISNLDRGKFDVLYNGMIWSETNKFAHGTITNIWPLTNAVAGQLLTSAGGAGAQMYWSTVSASGPSFADLVWTNTGTAIQPTGVGANTNAIKIYPGGAVGTGLGAEGFFGPLDGNYSFVSVHDTTAGDSPVNNLYIYSYNGIDGNYFQMFTGTNYTILEQASEKSGGVDKIKFETGVGGDGFLVRQRFMVDGTDRLDFNPAVADGSTPYTFDTSLAHTSGNLNEWKNLGVTHLTLAATNGITTPAITAYGAVSKAWQFGAASNTVNVQLEATNVVEITVAGVAYLIPAKLK